MDEPGWVASHIVRAIEKERSEAYMGFPENLFARLNGVFPSLIDGALRKALPDLAYHARRFVPACRSLAHSPLERRHPIVSAQQEMIDSSDENGVWM